MIRIIQKVEKVPISLALVTENMQVETCCRRGVICSFREGQGLHCSSNLIDLLIDTILGKNEQTLAIFALIRTQDSRRKRKHVYMETMSAQKLSPHDEHPPVPEHAN
ncbi:hypothetical protein Trydic_g12637 [Trypoxylus dichotomus]